MCMRSLSAYDIRHIVRELQFMIGGKIEKVFQNQDQLLFSIHVPSVGKHYVFIQTPDVFCQSEFKPSFPNVPPFFAASLRRKITNARIHSIKQHGFERIIDITLLTKNGESTLVVELITPGNVILHTDVCLAILHPKKFADRSILPNKPYEYPPKQSTPLEWSFEDFCEVVKNSSKEDVVKFFAVDCSLGGMYAEELLARLDISKSNALKGQDLRVLFDGLTEFLNLPTHPTLGDEPYPVVMVTHKGTDIPSFNLAIQHEIFEKLLLKEQTLMAGEQKQKMSKLDKVVTSQTLQLKGLEKKEQENQQKGELIYTHYDAVKSVLEDIAELRKTQSLQEIKKKYPSIDEKNGTVTVELK